MSAKYEVHWQHEDGTWCEHGGPAKVVALGEFESIDDLRDLARVAHVYLLIERCRKCKRFTNKIYCCVHCGDNGA